MTLTGWQLIASKLVCIPQRWILAVMCFLSILNAYTMRVALSISIVEMTSTNCTQSVGCKSSITDQNDVYDWSEQQRGFILGSFYWGYAITHVPGGLLAEKYGGKHCLGLGILSTAIFTILTPAVTRMSWIGLAILRMLMGAGEGVTFPAIANMLSKWVPEDERSKLGSLAYTGSLLGTVIGNAIGGILIHETGTWSSVYYFFGSLAIVWFAFWSVLCFSDPSEHPYISEKEKEYLAANVLNLSKKKGKTPWKALFLNVPVWALVAAQVGHDWGFYVMVTNLPTYFKSVLGFSIKDNGFYSSVPYIFMLVCSLLFGVLCDYLIKNGRMSITFSRKFWTVIASFGPSLFIMLAGYTHDRIWAVFNFTIAMGLMGGFYCGMKVNSLDLSPNFAGTLMGVVNGIGALMGIAAPYLAEVMTKDQTVEEWRMVFWMATAVFLGTCIIYCIWGSAKVQPFNEIEEEDADQKP